MAIGRAFAEMNAGTPAAMPSRLGEFFVRAEALVGRAICGLSGHSTVFHFEPTRLSLRCVLCGYETTGWEIASGRGKVAHRDAGRSALYFRIG